MRKNTYLNNKGFFKKNLLYIGFVMMAVTIPFIYNNCGQAQFGVDSARSTSVVQTNTDLCLSNQVAVGVDVNGEVLCAQKISHQGQLCPVGQTLYDYDDITDTAQCLKNCEFAGNVNNSLCPIGQNITSVGLNNSVLCQSHPSYIGLIGTSVSNYLLGFNLDGNPVTEVLVACPGTETALNVECPGTQELIEIIDGANGKEAVCRDIVFSPVNALCPEGQAHIGASQNQIVCQSLFNGSQNLEDKNCSAGTYLDIVNGALTCKPLPQENDSHVCPANSFSVGIINGLPSCRALEGEKFNGTCDPGQYIIGHVDGEIICEILPASGNFNEACSNGTYPHAYFNNTLECLQYSYNQQVCVPQNIEQCAVNNGLGSRTCNSDGTAYGPCEVDSCSTGYELNSLGLCVGIVPPPLPTPLPIPVCAAGLERINDVCTDIARPSVSINTKPVLSTEDTFANFTVEAMDNVGVASLECRLRNPDGSWTAYEDCKDSASGSTALGSRNYTGLTPGTYIFRTRATDVEGLQSTVDYRWTIRLTCEAGFKVSGSVCTPICGTDKILRGNLCIDRYRWVTGRKDGKTNGEKGERSYAEACASVSGYNPIATTIYKIPQYASENRGEDTFTAGRDLEICRSNQIDDDPRIRGLNIHRENGEWRCYDIYANQKTNDQDRDKVSWYRCEADATSSVAQPTTPVCSAGTYYSAALSRCITISVPSSSGGLFNFRNYQHR